MQAKSSPSPSSATSVRGVPTFSPTTTADFTTTGAGNRIRGHRGHSRTQSAMVVPNPAPDLTGRRWAQTCCLPTAMAVTPLRRWRWRAGVATVSRPRGTTLALPVVPEAGDPRCSQAWWRPAQTPSTMVIACSRGSLPPRLGLGSEALPTVPAPKHLEDRHRPPPLQRTPHGSAPGDRG